MENENFEKMCINEIMEAINNIDRDNFEEYLRFAKTWKKFPIKSKEKF